MRYTHRLPILLILVIATLTGCRNEQPARRTTAEATTPSTASATQTVPTALRNVRVRLDWTPWAPHAAFYAADRLGFFAAEGLKVRLYVPPDPETTIKLVTQGQDDFGISYMTDTILARAQGFKVVSVGALVPHPLNCIMTLQSSGIDTPAKLRNKTIATTGVPSDGAFVTWVLERNGVPGSAVRRVNVGFSLAPALTSGRADAIVGAYWPWEGIKLEQEGRKVNIMRLQDYGVPDYYELILVTRDELVQRDPELVRGLLRALSKGQNYVDQHPAEGVELLRTVSPDLTKDFLTASMNVTLPIMRPTSGPRFGQDAAVWSEMINFMRSAGLLSAPVEPSAVFNPNFVSLSP
jgi:putative hydroxymethylpyrimidine transport system substrate-binding protein